MQDGKVSFLIEEKIVKDGEKGQLLKARLIKSEKQWGSVKISGWGVTRKRAFFLSGNKWHRAGPGDYVFGFVIGDDLEIDSAPENLYEIENDLTEEGIESIL